MSSSGQCDVFGDPHYTSFSGQDFMFLENCTYILVEETTPRHHLSVSVDNYFCEPSASCAKGIILKYQTNTVTLQVLQGADEMPILKVRLHKGMEMNALNCYVLCLQSTNIWFLHFCYFKLLEHV